MLKSLFKAFLFLTVAVGFTRTSYGLISAQAMLGTDSTELKDLPNGVGDMSLSGTTLGAGVLIDPIPLVPIGFGLGVQMPTTKGSKDGNDYELTGLVVDLQVKAWTPIGLFGLTPFLKAGYIPLGAYTMKMNFLVGGNSVEGKAPLKSSGTHLAIGVNYSFLPLIDVLFQVSMRNETMEFEDFNLLGQEIKISDSVGKSSTNLLVGLDVGF